MGPPWAAMAHGRPGLISPDPSGGDQVSDKQGKGHRHLPPHPTHSDSTPCQGFYSTYMNDKEFPPFPTERGVELDGIGSHATCSAARETQQWFNGTGRELIIVERSCEKPIN